MSAWKVSNSLSILGSKNFHLFSTASYSQKNCVAIRSTEGKKTFSFSGLRFKTKFTCTFVQSACKLNLSGLRLGNAVCLLERTTGIHGIRVRFASKSSHSAQPGGGERGGRWGVIKYVWVRLNVSTNSYRLLGRLLDVCIFHYVARILWHTCRIRLTCSDVHSVDGRSCMYGRTECIQPRFHEPCRLRVELKSFLVKRKTSVLQL